MFKTVIDLYLGKLSLLRVLSGSVKAGETLLDTSRGLEPVALVKVRVPKGVMGDVIGDLNTRRGCILGIDSEGAVNTISAHVPMAEIQSYSPDLHSLTGRRGVVSLKFDHYAEVPQSLSERLLAERRSRRQRATSAGAGSRPCGR